MAQTLCPYRPPLSGLTLAGLLIPTLLAMGCRMEERSPDDPPQVQQVEPSGHLEAEGEREIRSDPPTPVLDVGDAFWAGEDTRAAELTATFLSQETLATYLDRSQLAARTGDGRLWVLGDILVSVEFPGAAARAIWRVAGPEEVIALYLERVRELEMAREEPPVRDLGILSLEVRHCCSQESPQRRLPQ